MHVGALWHNTYSWAISNPMPSYEQAMCWTQNLVWKTFIWQEISSFCKGCGFCCCKGTWHWVSRGTQQCQGKSPWRCSCGEGCCKSDWPQMLCRPEGRLMEWVGKLRQGEFKHHPDPWEGKIAPTLSKVWLKPAVPLKGKGQALLCQAPSNKKPVYTGPTPVPCEVEGKRAWRHSMLLSLVMLVSMNSGNSDWAGSKSVEGSGQIKPHVNINWS